MSADFGKLITVMRRVTLVQLPILCAILSATLYGLGCEPSADDAHVAAMANEHRGDTPMASPAALALPRAPVEAAEVVYGRVGARALRGYLARAAGRTDPAPGILLIHEWWGLNDNIRSMARRLAGEGYSALAVDLYDGRVAGDAGAARSLMSQSLENADAIHQNLRQAYRYLESEQQAPRIGSVGWCFGGGWSLQAALLLPGELDAAVIYYGRLVLDRERLQTVDTPLLGLFGEADGGIPVDAVLRFEALLEELGADAEIRIYPGAHHAFANPSGSHYDATAAQDAWGRTLAFFRRTLGAS